MDPLTALGLASNVFSCVSFASDLIKGTIEISASTNGYSVDTSKLGTVYKQLESLCDGLKCCTEHQIIKGDERDQVGRVVVAVKSLSKICKTDCDELLRIMQKLKTKDGTKGKWESFRTALKTAWEKKNMDELEERLCKTQITLTLHICTLAK